MTFLKKILTVFKNSANSGARVFTDTTANGTFGDLVITDSMDYGIKSGASQGFWRSFDCSASGSATANGWNEVYITHSSGSNSNTAYWYYDASSPGAPQITSTSIKANPGSCSNAHGGL